LPSARRASTESVRAALRAVAFSGYWLPDTAYQLLSRPGFVDRFCRISGDLDIGAMMVGVTAVLVVAVILHELDDLQRALLAVDVRQLHVGLVRWKRCPGRRPSVVHEQPVGEHRHLRIALDSAGDRPRSLFGLTRDGNRIGRQLIDGF